MVYYEDDILVAVGETLQLNQFIIDREIGQGQFSVVNKAIFIPDGRSVAIKHVQLLEMVDSKARNDCIKEIQLLKQLNHKNIVRYYGCIEPSERGSQLLIVLELAAAGDLSQFLANCQRKKRMLTERTIWNFFRQIASAVEHIHSKRICHRDIKPANVFVTSDLVVKLGDLGLGKFFNSKTVAAHSLVGTPYYMSPERLNQFGYDFSSDIWSLGCLLYEMAALQPPFNGFKKNWTALRQNIGRCEYPPLPSDFYSVTMRKLVEYCLQRTPTARPTAAEVLSISETLHNAYAVSPLVTLHVQPLTTHSSPPTGGSTDHSTFSPPKGSMKTEQWI